jgi:hypothetical protein
MRRLHLVLLYLVAPLELPHRLQPSVHRQLALPLSALQRLDQGNQVDLVDMQQVLCNKWMLVQRYLAGAQRGVRAQQLLLL